MRKRKLLSEAKREESVERKRSLTIHYILQEVRFTEPELFKYMMSQFIAEFSSATISYLQSEEELSRLYVTPPQYFLQD
ncbi:uncharacterized protein [Malus domestica]|uniref:uncharacterized protein isoform X5 n=1 Tax=Malus domestica TaxID=3750 RepID=UPI003976A572